MKRLIAILALGVGTLFAQSPASSSDQDTARKAKGLLEQAIQALGGPAYLNLQDTTQEGRSYTFHHGETTSAGILFWRFSKFPDRERVEFGKKRDIKYVYNGDRGYEITFKGTASEDPKSLAEYLRRRRYSLDWVLRRWLTEPGVALFYDGPALAEQKQAEKVTILSAKNEAVTLFLDPGTHLPLKKTYTWRDPVDREKDVEDEIYDAYRNVQGIMTPFSITRFYNGDMSAQRFLHTVKYNQGLGDDLFAAQTSMEASAPAKK